MMEWFVWVRVLRLRSGCVSRIAALIFRRARVAFVTSCAKTRFFLPSARQQGPPRLTQRGCRGKSARGEQANQSVQRFHPPNPGKITNNQPSPPNPEGHSVPGGRFCHRRAILSPEGDSVSGGRFRQSPPAVLLNPSTIPPSLDKNTLPTPGTCAVSTLHRQKHSPNTAKPPQYRPKFPSREGATTPGG